MKCQAWVDPAKFNKKGLPTPRAVIGTYRLDWDRFISEAKGPRRTKREELRARAVRCNGRLTVMLSVESDGMEYLNNVEVDVYCELCRDSSNAPGLNLEVAIQWLEDRIAAIP